MTKGSSFRETVVEDGQKQVEKMKVEAPPEGHLKFKGRKVAGKESPLTTDYAFAS